MTKNQTHTVHGISFATLPHPVIARLKKSDLVTSSPYLSNFIDRDLKLFGIDDDGTRVSFAMKEDLVPTACAKIDVFLNPGSILTQMVTL